MQTICRDGKFNHRDRVFSKALSAIQGMTVSVKEVSGLNKESLEKLLPIQKKKSASWIFITLNTKLFNKHFCGISELFIIYWLKSSTNEYRHD